MEVQRTICVPRDVVVRVHRNLVDGVVYTMPTTEIALPAGCALRRGSIPIPTSLPPMVWYRYDVTLERCNPLRCQRVPLTPFWLKFDRPWPPRDAPRSPDTRPPL